MTYYGAKELAASFRTVRKNTITVAEDIPEEQYDFRAAPGTRTVAEMLAHVAVGTLWQQQFHGVERKTSISFDEFEQYMKQVQAAEQALRTKAQLLDALRDHGERFASWLESLSDEVLAERIHFPPPVDPPTKTRFELLLSVKEHEMHHRAQLMLVERLLGIVPHLTRRFQEQMAARAAATKG